MRDDCFSGFSGLKVAPAAMAMGLVLLSVAVPVSAGAAAFSTRTEDPAGLGQSYGGITAHPVALSSQYYNPAHLAAFDRQAVLAGVAVQMPVLKARKASATTAVGSPVAGAQDNGNASHPAPLPSFAAVLPLTHRLKAGLDVTVPWGLSTSYESDWVGRYHGLTSEIRAVNATPALAYQLTDTLAIGGGIQVQQTRVRLTNAVDCGTLDIANGLGLGLTPGTPASDCTADMAGDDWGYGFTVGGTWQVTPRTALGAAYRSSVEHTLRGDVRYDVPAPLLAAILPDAGVSAGLTTPSLLSAGVSHAITDRLRLGLDVQRVGWSAYEDLRADFDGTQADAVTRADWHDVWFVGAGTEYAARHDLKIRTGVAFEQSPVPDATRDPRVPVGETWWFGMGASYTPLPAVSVDVTAFHAWFGDTSSTLPVDGVDSSLNADYTAQNTVLAVQARVGF
jgi:long-chain fatty acid transport protein